MRILMSKRQPTFLGLAVPFYDIVKVRETILNSFDYIAPSETIGKEIILKFPLSMLDRLMLTFPQAHISDRLSNYLIEKDQEEFEALHANPPVINTSHWNKEYPLYPFRP